MCIFQCYSLNSFHPFLPLLCLQVHSLFVSIPALKSGSSVPGEGNSSPLQYSGIENSMDFNIYGNAKSQTRLSDFHHFSRFHVCSLINDIYLSLSDLLYYVFVNSSETITSKKYAQQINEMHQKLQCLQLVLVKQNRPNSSPQHLMHVT